MFTIGEYMEKFPEFGKEEYPNFCSACGVILTNEDGVMQEARMIKSKYENKKRITDKKGSLFLAELDKLNELSSLGSSQIRHNMCEGISKYCPFDGEKLKIYGFQGEGEECETNLICSSCGYTATRPMTRKDDIIIEPVDIVGKFLLRGHLPQKALI